MKEKICIFNVDGDISAIECNATEADIIFKKATESTLSVILPATGGANAASDKGTLYISCDRQTRLPLPFRHRLTITVSVPEHIVPALSVTSRKGDVKLEGGIYGEIAININSGNASISDTDAEGAEINGDDLDVFISDSTFKRGLFVNARSTEFLAQNTFAGFAVVRSKQGNIGIVGLNTRDCVLETENGNITAKIVGRKEDFNLRITQKSASSPTTEEGERTAKNSFSAYTAKGSVVVDFIDDERAADELVFCDEVGSSDSSAAEGDKEN